jgi:hypothetical protein
MNGNSLRYKNYLFKFKKQGNKLNLYTDVIQYLKTYFIQANKQHHLYVQVLVAMPP